MSNFFATLSQTVLCKLVLVLFIRHFDVKANVRKAALVSRFLLSERSFSSCGAFSEWFLDNRFSVFCSIDPFLPVILVFVEIVILVDVCLIFNPLKLIAQCF